MRVQLIFDTLKTKEKFMQGLRKQRVKKRWSSIIQINLDWITKAIQQAFKEIRAGKSTGLSRRGSNYSEAYKKREEIL